MGVANILRHNVRVRHPKSPRLWWLGLPMTVVVSISQNFRAWGVMPSYSLFKSPFCHVTFIVSNCSPMTGHSIYLKKVLTRAAEHATLQNLRSKSEVRVKQKQRWRKFIKFFLICFMLHSSLASRTFIRGLLLCLLLLLHKVLRPGSQGVYLWLSLIFSGGCVGF